VGKREEERAPTTPNLTCHADLGGNSKANVRQQDYKGSSTIVSSHRRDDRTGPRPKENPAKAVREAVVVPFFVLAILLVLAVVAVLFIIFYLTRRW
jgi:hypothetical protein